MVGAVVVVVVGAVVVGRVVGVTPDPRPMISTTRPTALSKRSNAVMNSAVAARRRSPVSEERSPARTARAASAIWPAADHAARCSTGRPRSAGGSMNPTSSRNRSALDSSLLMAASVSW